MKRAGEDRESQNADFQQTVSDQRAAQTVLQRAVEVLEKVYAKKGSSLVEVRLHSDGEHKQPGPPPPPGFKESAPPDTRRNDPCCASAQWHWVICF